MRSLRRISRSAILASLAAGASVATLTIDALAVMESIAAVATSSSSSSSSSSSTSPKRPPEDFQRSGGNDNNDGYDPGAAAPAGAAGIFRDLYDSQYEIFPAEKLASRFQSLASEYPEYVTLTTAAERYGLRRAGGSNDCPFDTTNDGCDVQIITVFDRLAYPDDPDADDGYLARTGEYDDGTGTTAGGKSYGEDRNSGWRYLPDVFLSGSVHGDERVGPTSVYWAVELMLASAKCEASPREELRPVSKNNNADDDTAWQTELAFAKTCRADLLVERGIDDSNRRWLARLVTTRRTVALPTANALGYYTNSRTESGVDPNRDFPYDVEHARDCMKTVAGRAINEVWRDHLFQLGLTFHGGMEVIGYEWGAPTYLHKSSPDLLAQRTIASSYSRYAGAFPNHRAYDYGDMNDKVYYVRGGMEDWAFAGSWDPDRVTECKPTTYGGSDQEPSYPSEKTRYNNATLRAFNMLVETSDMKEPPRESLGNRERPADAPKGLNDEGRNGHIARNIRLALMAVEAVEPYVTIEGVEGLRLQDSDVIPGVNPHGDGDTRNTNGATSFFEHARTVWVASSATNKRNVRTVAWTVGGCFEVDETVLAVGPWDALPESLQGDDGFYPSIEAERWLRSSNEFQIVRPTNLDPSSSLKKDNGGASGAAGRSRWHADGSFPTISSLVDNDSADQLGPTFEASVDVSDYPSGTILAVFALARVDSAWAGHGPPNVAPANVDSVSHIVNARTNPAYRAMSAGKIVRGRSGNWFYSRPVTVVVGGREDEIEGKLDRISQDDESAVKMGEDGRVAVLKVGEDGQLAVTQINTRTAGTVGISMEGLVRHPSSRGRLSSRIEKAGGGEERMSTSTALVVTMSFLVAISSLVVFVVVAKRRRRRLGMGKVVTSDDDFEVSMEDDGEMELRGSRYEDDDGFAFASPRMRVD